MATTIKFGNTILVKSICSKLVTNVLGGKTIQSPPSVLMVVFCLLETAREQAEGIMND